MRIGNQLKKLHRNKKHSLDDSRSVHHSDDSPKINIISMVNPRPEINTIVPADSNCVEPVDAKNLEEASVVEGPEFVVLIPQEEPVSHECYTIVFSKPDVTLHETKVIMVRITLKTLYPQQKVNVWNQKQPKVGENKAVLKPSGSYDHSSNM